MHFYAIHDYFIAKTNENNRFDEIFQQQHGQQIHTKKQHLSNGARCLMQFCFCANNNAFN